MCPRLPAPFLAHPVTQKLTGTKRLRLLVSLARAERYDAAEASLVLLRGQNCFIDAVVHEHTINTCTDSHDGEGGGSAAPTDTDV